MILIQCKATGAKTTSSLAEEEYRGKYNFYKADNFSMIFILCEAIGVETYVEPRRGGIARKITALAKLVRGELAYLHIRI